MAFADDNLPALESWCDTWPLPIGKRVVASLEGWGRGYEALLNLMPFEDNEEALWVLRLESSGATLDLFGLAVYVDDPPLCLEAGELAYVMRGRGHVSRTGGAHMVRKTDVLRPQTGFEDRPGHQAHAFQEQRS